MEAEKYVHVPLVAEILGYVVSIHNDEADLKIIKLSS